MIMEEGGTGVTIYDRSMAELINAFCLFMHEAHCIRNFCIEIGQISDFVRFCLAWRLYAYFSNPKIKKKNMKRPKVDVVFVGGPYASRRDLCCGHLLMVYHDLFQIPVSTTSRAKEDWEIDGVDFS